LYHWSGYDGAEIYLYATWDSLQEDEAGVPSDPNATGLVQGIRYKNTSLAPKSLVVGGRTFIAEAGTPDTTLSIPAGQRPNMYSTPWGVY